MAFFDNLFGKEKKKENKNRGTRIETYAQARNYWNTRAAVWARTPHNMNDMEATLRALSKNPFVHYTFGTEKNARNALLEVPFINEDTNSGELISTETFDFGYYLDPNDKRFHAVVGGIGMSHETWTDINRIFLKHDGTKEMGNVEPYQ